MGTPFRSSRQTGDTFHLMNLNDTHFLVFEMACRVNLVTAFHFGVLNVSLVRRIYVAFSFPFWFFAFFFVIRAITMKT